MIGQTAFLLLVAGCGAGSRDAALAAAVAQRQVYATSFDGAESPLSEGGAWVNRGLDWTFVAKVDGVAYGTQGGSTSAPRSRRYDDSYAHLTGFAPNQKVSIVLHRSNLIDDSCSHEFEILLRWSDAPHGARGYEINLSYDGSYQQVVRWNGAYGDFTPLAENMHPALKDGDEFEATIVGNVITTYINKHRVLRVADETHRTGDPGIGFFRGDCGSNDMIGIASFEAVGSDGPLPDEG
jgi:hypothetical protein